MDKDLARVDTRCPVVRRESGPWCRLLDVSGGLGAHRRVTFDVEVDWVRSTDGRVRVTYADGTRPLLDGHVTDFYGYGTSVPETVELARREAVRLGARPGSELVVEAVTIVTDTPLVRASRDELACVGRRAYVVPPGDWLRPDDAWLAEATAFVEAGRTGYMGIDARPAYVGPVEVARVVTWSSAVADDAPERAGMLASALYHLVRGMPEETVAELREGWAGWVASGCVRK